MKDASKRLTLPGPEDIHRTELRNGITVLSRENFNSSSVMITGYIATGSLLDPDEKLGLADFTASGLMRGTARNQFNQIYDLLEGAGAILGFSANLHTTGFSGRALNEDLDLILDLLGEALREPVFPADHVERLRALHLTSLAIRAQDTEAMASLAFDQVIYKDHPYRRPEDGYPETVAQITREDLVAFHRNTFGPRGMVLVVVGAVNPQLVVEKVSVRLEDWKNDDQPIIPQLPELKPLEKESFCKVNLNGKSQADLVVGVPGPARRSSDFLAAALGNNILGQFGLYGRIGEAIREKAGLAYYAYSGLSGGAGPGPWAVYAGVDPKHVRVAVKQIKEELTRFVNELVSTEELENSQSNFIGSLPISLESNAGVGAAILNLERNHLGLDYYQRYPDLIKEITVSNILNAAQYYFDLDRLCIAVAGP